MAAATTIIAATALAGVLASTAAQAKQAKEAAKDSKREADRQAQEQAALLQKQKDQEQVTKQQEQFKKGVGSTFKPVVGKGGTLLTSPLGLGAQGQPAGGATLLGS